MARLKSEDIKGFRILELDVCVECATDEETQDLPIESVITQENLNKDYADGEEIYCDRCRKNLDR